LNAVPTFTARNSPREQLPAAGSAFLRYELRALQMRIEHIDAALPGMRSPLFIEKAQRSRATALTRIAAIEAELTTHKDNA
jgi:hypothetical protein